MHSHAQEITAVSPRLTPSSARPTSVNPTVPLTGRGRIEARKAPLPNAFVVRGLLASGNPHRARHFFQRSDAANRQAPEHSVNWYGFRWRHQISTVRKVATTN